MTTYLRRLGLFSGTMAVVGGIIGGGIFRTPATVAERLGSPGFVLLAWVIGGVIALIGAFCFGELGQRRPRAGGGYVYLRETFGPLPAFLYGWTLVLVIATGAIAAVAVTFADYTLALLGLPHSYSVPLAVAAIVFHAGINYIGVRPAAITQNIFTVLKLVALAVLIAGGLLLGLPSPPSGAPSPPPHFAALGTALVPILFTYGGWQQTNFIAEEIVEPERNLPRALLIGVAIVVTVYLLTNLAYLRVLGIDGLARSTAPAADTMTAVLGPVGGKVIAAGIAVSTFAFLNLVILVTPRVLQAMAADGVFFRRFAELHPVHHTPAAAIVALAVFAVLLTLSGTFGQLVDYVTFGDWIFFGSTVACLYVYRARDPGPRAGFGVPGYPITPALFVLAAAFVVFSAITSNPKNAAIGAGLIALGIPAYLYWRSRSMRRTAALLIIAFGAARSLAAQHDHDHAEQLGRVVFPTSCNATAQRDFERAMTYLHSFWWEQGLTAFQAVVSADSTCAMGYWGLALNAWGNPFAGGAPPTSENARRGAAAASHAAALGAPTPREQGFIAAAAALYRGLDSVPNSRRLQAYSDTLARVYHDFPNDAEVAIYYALSLVETAPKTDTTFARQRRAAAILNPLFQRFPTHPGLAHYIIHANDSPQLAALGLDAARRYAVIAPAAPHARHMPSHIFIRRGLWDETIAANRRAFQAGVDYAHTQHTSVAPEQIHALDYMVYAYLQEGRDSAARRTVAEARALETTLANDVLVANYNQVAMEARLPLERGDWAAAAQLPVRASGMTIGAALSHFARGIGAARTSDTAGARVAIAALTAIEADMTRRGDNDWARVVAIKRQLVTAWTELAAGDTAAALRDVKGAADIEDVTEKQPITPGELLPARELEGDMLLAVGRPADARAAYEACLAREPNRARSLYGSARAAELAGDKEAARLRYAAYLTQMGSADGDRVEIARARAALR